tara:strand:+ start:25 stop:840 length:816 start_codon:yes stop_codon:yes gene_type:complete
MLGLGLGAGKLSYVPVAGYTNAQSLDLDGTGDYVETNYTDAALQTLIRGSFSVSMWIRAPYNASFNLFGYEDTGTSVAGKFELNYTYLNAAVDAFVASGKSSNQNWTGITSINPTATNSSNAWIHVAYTVVKGPDDSTKGTHNIYTNGSLLASAASAEKNYFEATEVTAGRGLAIGAINNNGTVSGHMTGQIDEVGIFGVALDADAVAAIYNSGVPFDLTENNGNYDNSLKLARYYRFEGTGQTALQLDRGRNEVNISLEGNPTASSEVPS